MHALGVHDVLTKAFGSGNSQNVAKATLNALAKLRLATRIAAMRGMMVKTIVKGEQNV
jgi:small subunit ribosomal protein S5